jgi:hypothetical protein
LTAATPEFEANSGQVDPRYRFFARAGATRAYIEDRGLTFGAPSGHSVRIVWAGPADPSPEDPDRWSITEPSGNIFHYCNQPRSEPCTLGVPTYRRLIRRELYAGVDWTLHERDHRVEDDLVLHPGANPAEITLRVEGTLPRLAADGTLHAGNLVHWRPEAYRWIGDRKATVEVALAASGAGEFPFRVGAYRRDLDLIIDPVIETIGVAGGSGEDDGANTRTGYAFAGETDDPTWPGAALDRIGPGGKLDAIAGLMDGGQLKLFAIGGSGSERAMRLRDAGQGYWAIAGETDSADFPSVDGPYAAAGADLWIGRLRLDTWEITGLRVFGGSGEDHLGGLAAIPGQALYLAGTTNSTDLPAASGPYQGGATDGFLSVLDPTSAEPRLTTYIGGSGRDEIAALDTASGDVFLGGATGSPDLPLPGLPPGGSALGGLDALFVLCDTFGAPARAIRLGGTGDDRILGVEPVGLGKVRLAGASDSTGWLHGLDEFRTGLGGQDGFLVSASLAELRAGTDSFQNSLYIGQDLQAALSLKAVSEEGMDGVAIVRSSDPSRLLVSTRSDGPGTDQILLRDVDLDPTYPKFFVIPIRVVEAVPGTRRGGSSSGVRQQPTIVCDAELRDREL